MSGNSTISREFFADINRIKQSTHKENRRLVALAQAGDKEARDRLVEGNMAFVVHEARKRLHVISSRLDELVQDAAIGLMDAVDPYDPDRGAEFLTFARRLMANSMLIGSRHELAVSTPKHHTQTGRLSDAAEAKMANALKPHKSLCKRQEGSVSGADGEMRQDLIPCQGPQSDALVEGCFDYRLTQQMLSVIDDDRLSYIISERFWGNDGEGRTLSDIGADLEISREAVRQNLERGMDWLRAMYAREGKLWSGK